MPINASNMESNDPVHLLHCTNLSDDEFQAIRALVHTSFGINLNDDKRSLVAGRLNKVLKRRKFASFRDYHQFVVNDTSGQALEELAACISTNHTFFFREREHFDFLRKVAFQEMSARHLQKGEKDLRIWSAGCASGEEAYSIVILMLEHFGREYNQWSAGLLATDISSKALQQARCGTYNSDKLELVPEDYRHKYFQQVGDDAWAVSPAVKREVTFRSLNLMNHSFPFKKQFDIIFCRNVMIYFDQATRDELVRRFFEWTVPGGYLFIGHSESLRRDACPYTYIMPALYRKESP